MDALSAPEPSRSGRGLFPFARQDDGLKRRSCATWQCIPSTQAHLRNEMSHHNPEYDDEPSVPLAANPARVPLGRGTKTRGTRTRGGDRTRDVRNERINAFHPSIPPSFHPPVPPFFRPSVLPPSRPFIPSSFHPSVLPFFHIFRSSSLPFLHSPSPTKRAPYSALRVRHSALRRPETACAGRFGAGRMRETRRIGSTQ